MPRVFLLYDRGTRIIKFSWNQTCDAAMQNEPEISLKRNVQQLSFLLYRYTIQPNNCISLNSQKMKILLCPYFEFRCLWFSLLTFETIEISRGFRSCQASRGSPLSCTFQPWKRSNGNAAPTLSSSQHDTARFNLALFVFLQLFLSLLFARYPVFPSSSQRLFVVFHDFILVRTIAIESPLLRLVFLFLNAEVVISFAKRVDYLENMVFSEKVEIA